MMLTPGADVVPLDDLRTHDVPGGYDNTRDDLPWLIVERPSVATFTECWCQPRVEPLAFPNGQLSTLYVHRAMDRREKQEKSE